MTDQEKLNKIVEIMEKSELDAPGQEQLRMFLISIMNEAQFEKIVRILSDFPSVFENFIRCFDLKRRFVAEGGDAGEWNYIIEKEKEMLAALPPDEA
jgi:hypothetical protein